MIETSGQALVEYIRSVRGEVHPYIGEGELSQGFYELLSPEVAEIAVICPEKRQGSKSDRIDAETLARRGRMDPKRLRPIEDRGETAPQHRALLRARSRRAGTELLRRLWIEAAHDTLGPSGPDSELRRFGLRLQAQGGKRAKKRAVVAVARKLSVRLHRLWVTGEVYPPLAAAGEEAQAAYAEGRLRGRRETSGTRVPGRGRRTRARARHRRPSSWKGRSVGRLNRPRRQRRHTL